MWRHIRSGVAGEFRGILQRHISCCRLGLPFTTHTALRIASYLTDSLAVQCINHSELTSLASNLLFPPLALYSHLAARAPQTHEVEGDDNEFDQFRKRMMLSYRFRPNPMVRRTKL